MLIKKLENTDCIILVCHTLFTIRCNIFYSSPHAQRKMFEIFIERIRLVRGQYHTRVS